MDVSQIYYDLEYRFFVEGLLMIWMKMKFINYIRFNFWSWFLECRLWTVLKPNIAKNNSFISCS